MIQIKFFVHESLDDDSVIIEKSDLKIINLIHEELPFSHVSLVFNSIVENSFDLEKNCWYKCDVYYDNEDNGEEWYVSNNFIKIIDNK